MVDTPCGCDLEHEALGEPSEATRTVLENTAVNAQRMWRCPRAGYEHTSDTGSLYEAHLEADGKPDEKPGTIDTLEALGRMTGLQGCTTCPLYYVRQPWVECVVELYADRESGAVDSDHGPISAVMKDALRAVRSGVNARKAYEFKQLVERNKREADAREAERRKNGT